MHRNIIIIIIISHYHMHIKQSSKECPKLLFKYTIVIRENGRLRADNKYKHILQQTYEAR